MPKFRFSVHRKSKMAMKFDKKAIRNAEIYKNKQILIRTSNPQVFNKSTKNKPKFAGKLQGWQH